MIVGTAGHIDHGKTSLVRALTGIDTDRLEEEKRRGITIDIGFAHLQLGDIRVGFIDVPGHEKFVKNMLAGIGGINLLLLVVAADESVMPQTVEHFEICRLLEIPKGIIVLTKKSLADADLREVVAAETRELVAGSFLEQAPLVEVDSVTGEGIPELIDTIRRTLESSDTETVDYRRSHHVFQLPIDRVFTIRGFGTVVTGTAIAGSLAQDSGVTVLPPGLQSKVRGIELFGEASTTAEAGQRTALNLSGLATADLARGMIVAPSNTLSPTYKLDVSISLLPNAPAALKDRSPVRFHHGSCETIASVRLLEGESLEPGRQCLARLSLSEPLVCLPGDRFVLRRYSPMQTIGGGTVIHCSPGRLHRADLAATLERYQQLLPAIRESGSRRTSALLRFLVAERSLSGITIRELVEGTGIRESTLKEAVTQDRSLLVVEQDPLLIMDREAIRKAGESIRTMLEEFHRLKPLATGIPREELKERLLPRGSSIQFQAVLKELEQDRILSAQGSAICMHGRSVSLGPREEQLRERIVSLFRRYGFESPTLDQIKSELDAEPSLVQSLFYYLLQQGDLVKVSEDVILLRDQLESMVGRLREEFPTGTPFTVPQFKDIFGFSRKYAIPLLEHFDRQRITRRSGDTRTVLKAD